MKIAIASGKGGTGKTTLSTNLACYIAEKEPVLLCDLDVEEPNSGLFLELELKERIEEYKQVPSWDPELCIHCGKCSGICSFNGLVSMTDQVLVFPELCHSCYACSELCPSKALPMKPRPIGVTQEYQRGSLHFLESRLNLGEEQAVPLIHQTLSKAEKEYGSFPWILYDAAPGTSCSVIEIIRAADLVILVTEPTPFGLHDLKLAVETARILNKEILLLINRYEEPYKDLDDYIRDESLCVAGRIPLLKEIACLYSQGELLYTKIPQVQVVLEDIYFLLREKG